MPILDVEMILLPDEHPRPTLASEISEAAGAVFGSPPGRVWVRLHFLPHFQYAENGGPLPDGLGPVFVSVLHALGPVGVERDGEAARLTTALAAACGRPGQNIHVFYLPDGAGRGYFGGRAVT